MIKNPNVEENHNIWYPKSVDTVFTFGLMRNSACRSGCRSSFRWGVICRIIILIKIVDVALVQIKRVFSCKYRNIILKYLHIYVHCTWYVHVYLSFHICVLISMYIYIYVQTDGRTDVCMYVWFMVDISVQVYFCFTNNALWKINAPRYDIQNESFRQLMTH